MKIIHTSDLHLGSALTSRMGAERARERRRELRECFIRLGEEAIRIGAEAVIIAGDLFDEEKVSIKEIDSFLTTVQRCKSVHFFYLPGNHERDVLKRQMELTPENLHIFGSSWDCFTLGDVAFHGRSEVSADMFDTLHAKSGRKNIVILHGEVKGKSDSLGSIGLNEAAGHSIDYIALGHYHTYRAYEFESGKYAVYSGTPEGRGFDEAGQMGYVLIDTDTGLTHSFIPFAKRQILITEVDISTANSSFSLELLVKEKLKNIPTESIVRVLLTGGRAPELKYDIPYLTDALKSNFYYLEIKDKSRLVMRAEDYRYDKSLKGEFIRLCLGGGHEDALKEKIIECGLKALAGESDGK